MSIACPLSNSEHTSILRMLTDGQRLDGRTLSDYRQLVIKFPPPGSLTSSSGAGMGQGGCCLCRLGGTSVLAEVWCEAGEPNSRRPNEGQLNVNLDLGALTSAGSNSDESTRLQPMLKQCLRDCVDLEALCIVAGERVFLIRVEARVLSHDGNLLDCAALACLAALSTFRRPDVVVDDSGQVVIHRDFATREPVPLTLRHLPVVMSFGLGAAGKLIVVDPLLKEEAVLDGCLRVSMNTHKQISFLHTSGGMPVQEEHISRCLTMAERNVRGLYNFIQKALEGAEKHRAEKFRPVFLTSTSLLSTQHLPAATFNKTNGHKLSDGELSSDGEIPNAGGSDMELGSDGDENVLPSSESGPCNPYSMQEVSSSWGVLSTPDSTTPRPTPASKRKATDGRTLRDEEEETNHIVTLSEV